MVFMVEESIIDDFNKKLQMFENSLSNVSKDLSKKLNGLVRDANQVAENTSYLKKLKENYDQQNKRLKTMLDTIEEVQQRLHKLGGI